MDVAWREVPRRTLLFGGGGLLGAAALGEGARGRWAHEGRAVIPLRSETIAWRTSTLRESVPPGRAFSVVPGTRVLADSPERGALLDAEHAYLDGCAPWIAEAGALRGLVRGALLDLRTLTMGLPATVAGWSTPWRYVWPRDLAHVAVAFAVAGRYGEAVASIEYLAAVQLPDGTFEARYRIDGPGPPDDRPPQLDGIGWALWATSAVLRWLPPSERARVLSLGGFIRRVSAAAMEQTTRPGGLPAPSPDYWEVPEHSLTLGTATPIAMGLEHAAALHAHLGEHDRARAAASAASAMRARIDETFGSRGYTRYRSRGGRDSAVTFLLPPYVATTDTEALAAAHAAAHDLARPAGGLAPGADWADDGVSWTPETALFAQAWANTGNVEAAHSLLDWIARHRTAAGSVPEKVLFNGEPAEVAPLAWTAALVVTAAHALVTS